MNSDYRKQVAEATMYALGRLDACEDFQVGFAKFWLNSLPSPILAQVDSDLTVARCLAVLSRRVEK